MKKITFLIVFLVGLIFVSGCATVSHTSAGFGKGLVEDSKNIWQALIKADKWFDKHTW